MQALELLAKRAADPSVYPPTIVSRQLVALSELGYPEATKLLELRPDWRPTLRNRANRLVDRVKDSFSRNAATQEVQNKCEALFKL